MGGRREEGGDAISKLRDPRKRGSCFDEEEL